MISFKRKKKEKQLGSASIQNERSFILTDSSPFSIIEEYKALRTNILFSLPGDGCKIVGVTSANAQEGKSINSLNIAITFSQTNAKVLLMDCDLRLPKQSRLMEMSAIPGISNVLINMNSVDEAIKKTGYENLDIMLSGDIPPNPSELLGCDKMSHVMQTLKDRYDYIVVDLPPINVVSDAAVMSKFLSGIVLVIRSGMARKEEEVKAISQLQFAHANILGVVLNFAEGGNAEKYKSSKYAYKKSYQSYQYHQQYDDAKTSEKKQAAEYAEKGSVNPP